MGGLFGVASKKDCVSDLFFGIDYHSHLGTHRGGMTVYDGKFFDKSIHNIENAPFRTRFGNDMLEMKGYIGIGSISDSDPQPLIVRAHFGTFVLATVGRINNADELLNDMLNQRRGQFNERTSGEISTTELAASVISGSDNLIEGIQKAQQDIKGSMTMLVLTADGIYAARDYYGRTSLTIGKKEDAYAVSMENFAYQNLGYQDEYELGPKEIVKITPDGFSQISPPGEKMQICAFLWTYYGYPTASYSGRNVEEVRYLCGQALARRDKHMDVDGVSGVPDSGVAHALGYSHASGLPYNRPLIKYTPTWPRSFMPSNQSQRLHIAQMKLVSIPTLIKDKKLLLIDDSIVRGTQTKKMASYLFDEGAKEVHVRSASPPIMYGCRYLNFSRSTSEFDLITHRIIKELEGENYEKNLHLYTDANTAEHQAMVDEICKRSDFTSLKYMDLNDMIDAIGLEPCKVCKKCWLINREEDDD